MANTKSMELMTTIWIVTWTNQMLSVIIEMPWPPTGTAKEACNASQCFSYNLPYNIIRKKKRRRKVH
eukprot:785117-Ditylum_brightwellii.AAC.1